MQITSPPPPPPPDSFYSLPRCYKSQLVQVCYLYPVTPTPSPHIEIEIRPWISQELREMSQ